MKLFRIQFDGQSDYVEAETMPAAIEKWHTHCRSLDSQWDEPQTPEPEGCELAHEFPVIR